MDLNEGLLSLNSEVEYTIGVQSKYVRGVVRDYVTSYVSCSYSQQVSIPNSLFYNMNLVFCI